MQDTVFGGSRVGKDGIKPDIAKLEAVAKWPIPRNLLDLMRFLGLMGYFRSLIQDYSRIAAPLTDLQRNLELPQPAQCKGRRLRQFLRDHDLVPYWTAKHTKAFTKLKCILLGELVLCAPKFDGMPFIVIMDASKDGFGAILAQSLAITLPDGETKIEVHPIGYASKRTAPAEEHYKPYDLEFVALKFGLDHSSDTIWGFPVEIETHCHAMKDMLCNDILNLHHARWKDGIQSYCITAVRHRSGESNKAADVLNCMYTGREHTTDDGSMWLVCEDWEISRGIVNDLFGVYMDEVISSLCERFANEPLFLEVVRAIADHDNHKME